MSDTLTAIPVRLAAPTRNGSRRITELHATGLYRNVDPGTPGGPTVYVTARDAWGDSCTVHLSDLVHGDRAALLAAFPVQARHRR